MSADSIQWFDGRRRPNPAMVPCSPLRWALAEDMAVRNRRGIGNTIVCRVDDHDATGTRPPDAQSIADLGDMAGERIEASFDRVQRLLLSMHAG
jgi:hypothetical protein